MTQLTVRLDRFEDRLRSMESELAELRRLARAEGQTRATPAPAASPSRRSGRCSSRHRRARTAAARSAACTVGRVPGTVPGTGPSRPPREPLDLSVLLGARALAWTGGVVTLLGVIFFFVLAVDRGWIGPTARVTLGAAASAALVGAGVWLRRAYGDTYASVSSAGAGIAGFLRDPARRRGALRPDPGAMLVPVPVALQEGLTATSTTFACLVLAAATIVAVLRNWRGLLIASVAVTAPQAIALDLAFLSSIARAFSFLAVGGLILVAGFFYQRLAGGHTAART